MHTAMGLNLKNIMLCERNQTQKSSYGMFHLHEFLEQAKLASGDRNHNGDWFWKCVSGIDRKRAWGSVWGDGNILDLFLKK